MTYSLRFRCIGNSASSSFTSVVANLYLRRLISSGAVRNSALALNAPYVSHRAKVGAATATGALRVGSRLPGDVTALRPSTAPPFISIWRRSPPASVETPTQKVCRHSRPPANRPEMSTERIHGHATIRHGDASNSERLHMTALPPSLQVAAGCSAAPALFVPEHHYSVSRATVNNGGDVPAIGGTPALSILRLPAPLLRGARATSTQVL